MSEIWKQWIGHIVDSRFPLQQYLAHTEHSAVFLTEFTDTETHKAAIKFISVDTQEADHQLQIWSQTAQLHHPGLVTVFHAGRCSITEMDLLYIVTELAEENLAQILPQRALTPEETKQMLEPIVDALVYLHDKGLAHNHIKPSNILAAGDSLKLSVDTVAPIGESREPHRERDVYDAPETGGDSSAAYGDIWSLGETVVETLTQQTAALPFNDQADPIVPDYIPQPFQDIARHALRRDPSQRWTSAEIAARLNPAAAPKAQPEPIAVAVAAGASPNLPSGSMPPPSIPPPSDTSAVPPLGVPLSREPAVPLNKLQPPVVRGSKSYAVPPATPRDKRAQPPDHEFALPSYVVPLLLVGALVLIAILAVPRLFRHQPKVGPDTPALVTTVAPDKNSGKTSTNQAAKTPAPLVRTEKPSVSTARPAPDTNSAAQPSASTVSPAPASVPPSNSSAATSARTAGSSPEKGEVLNQVLPTASQSALSTIHGTVRVTVRAKVDPVGRVSDAELFAAGPSKYFAERALVAARQWEFSSPETNGHSMPSEWLIRFEFSQSGPTKAYPTQTAP
jgi:TonB family protein